MSAIADELHRRANNVPWAPDWAQVLAVYLDGRAAYPEPFRPRNPA